MVSVLVACQAEKTDLNSFQWLKGDWKAQFSDTSYFFEKWTMANDTSWTGIGGMVVNSDTIFAEQILVHQQKNDFYYRANVSENNGGVDFKYLGLINDSAVFENKAHDFPQQIVYYYKTPNRLYAHIAGFDKGKYRKEVFELQKEN